MSDKEALEFVRGALEFAYEHGLHEVGYDPVDVLIAEREGLEREVARLTIENERDDTIFRERAEAAESKLSALEAALKQIASPWPDHYSTMVSLEEAQDIARDALRAFLQPTVPVENNT